MATAPAQPTIEPAPAPVPAAGAPQRLLHIDALRGVLLILMGVNHVPGPLHSLTNHPLGFVSAAEGFVFLSGLMCGLVYSRRYYKAGLANLREATFGRARLVYLYHAATFVTVLVGLKVFAHLQGAPSPAAPPLLITDPFTSLLCALLFIQQPSLFDILPLYCVFLLVLPWLVVACIHGHRRGVVTGSFLIWATAIAFSPQHPLIKGFVNTGSFNLLAWQLLFIVGAVFGYNWAANRTAVLRPGVGKVLVALLLAALLFATRHAFIHLPLSPRWLDWLTNKNNLAPLRLLNAGLLFYLTYVLVSRFPRWFSWRPLAFLGQHSIFVFAVHILIAYAIQSFPAVFDGSEAGRWTSTGLMLATLFGAAIVHGKTQARAKRRKAEVLSRQAAEELPRMGHGSRTFDPADSVHRGGR